MKRLLIVDDEKKIREVLKEYAEYQGYMVDEANNGAEAVEACRTYTYDLILMDIMMPILDGYSALKEIRKNSNIPCIMITARTDEGDKLLGFKVGADDYVVKPFSPKEVMARVNAVLKRYENKANNQVDYIKFEGLEIDFIGHEVYVDGEKIKITPKEFDLLTYMTKNIGAALSRERLLHDVWDYNSYGDDRTVDTHVKMLRGNLKHYRKFIKTVRNVGYKFVV